MRISDWSSDVCSSDLRIKGVFFDAQIALGHIAVIGEALVQRLRLAAVNSLRRRQGIVGRRHHALATADLLIQMHKVGLQIGRASCRERECQYVYIWVSAVSYKKNKTISQ